VRLKFCSLSSNLSSRLLGVLLLGLLGTCDAAAQSSATSNPWNQTTTHHLLSGYVFDWQAYLALNPDLQRNGINSEASAVEHWLIYGALEGRQANGIFSVQRYLQLYSDVAAGCTGRLRYVCGIQNYAKNIYTAYGRFAVPIQQSYGGLLPRTTTVRAGVAGDAVIGNPLLKITTSSQYAGAINSLVYVDKQFINNVDHGRQIQMASLNYGMQECNNPTEAGAADDGAGPTSSSVLQQIVATPEYLWTNVSPAYWLKPNESSQACPANATLNNTTTVSLDQSFQKKIEINYFGTWQIFKMTIAAQLTHSFAPWMMSESVYLTPDFSSVYTYDPKLSLLVPMTLNPGLNIQGQVVPGIFDNGSANPPVLATPDGKYALAIVTPPSSRYYMTYPVQQGKFNPLYTTSNDSIASSVQYYFNSASGTQEFFIYVIVGTLAEVRQNLKQHYAQIMLGI
jgi:hypothetical protein